jgi:hypothetical protein
MKRKMCLNIVCAVVLLLVSAQKAPAQVVYNAYGYPITSYYPATYYDSYAPTYLGGAYYRPYDDWYGRAGYRGGNYWGNRYYGGRYWGGAYRGRYAYGVRAGYRVGGFRRW